MSCGAVYQSTHPSHSNELIMSTPHPPSFFSSGWFLHNKEGGSKPDGSFWVPQCDNAFTPPRCTSLYHDLDQASAGARAGAHLRLCLS